jgi:hypothetical protein
MATFANVGAFPAAGNAANLYVAADTNDTYRWDGAKYVRVSERVLSTGVTDSTVVGRAVVTAVDAKAGRTALNAGPDFNVKDYGAKGDGTTDDTAAIQACIDAAYTASLVVETKPTPQNKRFVTVNFPPGMYITSNLTVPDCITLEGNAATVRAKAGTTGYLISFTGGTGVAPTPYLFKGGMRRMRVMAAPQPNGDTDMLGGVWVKPWRQNISITDCAIERFHDSAVLLEGGNPVFRDNYVSGLSGDQDHLTAHKGVLHIQGQANDAWIDHNEINGARWHYNDEWAKPPAAARNMFVCAVAAIDVGYSMYSANVIEMGETGVYFKDVLNFHMSGDRSEFNWGHGFQFVGSSGRMDGCISTDNSKVESGKFDGYHFGAGDVSDQATNVQLSNCTSRSNNGGFNDFAQHRWAVWDNGYNNIYGNSHANLRSYGDVGVFSASDPARPKPSGFYYGGGPQYTIPQANSAFLLSGATPSVAGKTMFRCSGSTTITDFTGAVNGQMFYLLGNGAVTVANNTRIVMGSGADTIIPNGQWFVFMCHDGKIVQLDLSANTLTNKTIKSGRYDNFLTTLGLPGMVLDATPASVSSLRVSPGATGSPVTLRVDCTDATSPGLRLWPKGNAQVSIYADAGFSPSIYATGADANPNLTLSCKGTGIVKVGALQVETKGHTHTAADVVGARSWAAVPASAAAAGTAGQEAYDTGFHYICVTTGAAGLAAWKRTPLTTWTTP